MKAIAIYRGPSTRRLGFDVGEDHGLGCNEISTQLDVCRLQHQLRRSYGRSARLSGLVT